MNKKVDEVVALLKVNEDDQALTMLKQLNESDDNRLLSIYIADTCRMLEDEGDSFSAKKLTHLYALVSEQQIVSPPSGDETYVKVKYKNKVRARASQPKDKTTAILLCCLGFIGLSGMHKFYEGKPILGIAYLFTGGFFFIGTILDLFKLAKNDDTYNVR